MPAPEFAEPQDLRQKSGMGALSRVQSVDFYRGLIMVIMLLDHTRERVHFAGMSENPLDPATTNAALYLTRWITHLCAPGFVFLAGTSAGLLQLKGYTRPQLSRYLLTRGLALLFIELFVVRPLLFMDVEYLRMAAFLETIWAIGWSMVALSLLIRLPERALLVVGMLIVFGHNALDTVTVPQWFPGKPLPTMLHNLWMILHQAGFFPINLGRAGQLPGPIVFSSYPILPWIGVMTLGFCFARVFTWSSEQRVAHLRRAGLGMLALFFALRVVNVYGDPARWKSGATFAQTLYSFFNVQKYPPSLDFILATLGPCLLVLALVDRWPLNSTVAKWFMTFGRAPMFFFLVQWPYVHLAGVLVALSIGQPLTAFTANLVDFVFGPQPASTGGPLWMVYVAWILGALVLYFPVRWYAALKSRRRDIALLRFI